METINSKQLSYWRWLFCGSGGKSGVRRLLLNRWFLIHCLIGIFLARFVSTDINTTAYTVMIPLSGIFVGLSFAWAGNVHSLLTSPEIDQMADQHKGGFIEYVFVYQTSVLIILLAIIGWGLSGLGLAKGFSLIQQHHYIKLGLRALLFTLSSLALRECWHVIWGVQVSLIIRKFIKDKKS